jgi:hypothetical protein
MKNNIISHKKSFAQEVEAMRTMVKVLGFTLLLIALVGSVMAANQPRAVATDAAYLRISDDAQKSTGVKVSLISSDQSLTRIRYEIGQCATQEVEINDELYYRIVMGSEPNIMDKGMPDLPFVCRSIIIPDNARMDVQVTESKFVDYQIQVAPSRGHISRDINPQDVPYEFSEKYFSNQFYPQSLIKLGAPYILRDFRGVTVTVYPFAYNPVTQTLRVYTELVVEVRNVGVDSRNVKTKTVKVNNRYFTEIYENHFLNYDKGKYSPVGEHGRMIVITHADFVNAIRLYVNWKNQKGIPTEVYDVADIGTTADEIKAFIQNEYDLGDGLTFVQFVGDAGHIPTFLISRDFCDGLATSDPSYALLEGNDSYPDIFVGRFSGTTFADIETQVERTVWYERDIASGDWLHKGTGLGSIWGSGYGYMGLADWELVEMLRLMLLGYTYTEVDQLYEVDVGPYVEPVPVYEFVNAINEGRSIVLVQGHGPCEADFMIPPGSLGDLFVTDDLGTLENDYMLPFIWIGAPYIGNFQIDVTFPEAWLRVTDVSGDPIGAIAVYASSVDLDYASTHAAQYEMVDLLVNDQMNSIGGLMYNGSCFAIDLYAGRGEKTFKSYHIFGDACLQVRTDTPDIMTVQHESVIMVGSTTFEVTVVGVEGALCAISRNYELLGYGYTDATGGVTIQFDQPLSGMDPLDLTVTCYNKVTYTSQITVTTGEPIRGDANGDWVVDPADAVYLINYLFKDGPAPDPLWTGDCNGDEIVDPADVVYLINYLFRDGPPPGPGPVGILLGFEGCKDFPKAGGNTDPTPPDQDCIEYLYDDETGVLLLKHVNGGFNCCPDELLADINIEGNVITIEEDESLESGGCDCLCLFDVDYRISNLPAGEYTIVVYELYLMEGDEILQFTVDLSSTPSGSYCVQRDHYPWGMR